MIRIKSHLRQMLFDKNISQRDLAERANVSLTTVQYLYHGRGKAIYIEPLIKISKALDVQWNELFDIVDDESQNEDVGGSRGGEDRASG